MMPILAGLITSLFGALAGFLVQFVTKKIAFGLAAVAVVSGLVGALLLLMRGVVEPLWSSAVASLPALGWVGLAFPAAAEQSVTAWFAVWTACTLYSWQKTALAAFMRA